METIVINKFTSALDKIQIFLWGMETSLQLPLQFLTNTWFKSSYEEWKQESKRRAAERYLSIQIFLWGMETPTAILGHITLVWIQIFLWGMETALYIHSVYMEVWFKSSYEEWKQRFGSVNSHILCDSNLPMRNGNKKARGEEWVSTMRFKSSYEEWKLAMVDAAHPQVADSNLPMRNGNRAVSCTCTLSKTAIQIFLWGMETPYHEM